MRPSDALLPERKPRDRWSVSGVAMAEVKSSQMEASISQQQWQLRQSLPPMKSCHVCGQKEVPLRGRVWTYSTEMSSPSMVEAKPPLLAMRHLKWLRLSP